MLFVAKHKGMTPKEVSENAAYGEVYENAAKIKWNKIILICGFYIREELTIAVPKCDYSEDKTGGSIFLNVSVGWPMMWKNN